GVPDGGRQPPPRLQGGPERHRGHLAGVEVRLLLRVPRPSERTVPSHRRRGAGGAAAVHGLRLADARRRVRVLPPRRARRGRDRAGSTDREGSADAVSAPFAAGDKVLLIDAKQRRYLITLEAGGQFHSHAGYLPHDELIGAEDGSTVRSTRGAAYT